MHHRWRNALDRSLRHAPSAEAIHAETSDLVPAGDAKEIVFRLRQSANDLMDIDSKCQSKHTVDRLNPQPA